MAQDLGRGNEAILRAGAATSDAGAEKDTLNQSPLMQLHEQAGQLVGRKADAAKIASLAEGTIATVPLAGRGERRLEQRDPLAVGQRGVGDAIGEIVASLDRRQAA